MKITVIFRLVFVALEASRPWPRESWRTPHEGLGLSFGFEKLTGEKCNKYCKSGLHSIFIVLNTSKLLSTCYGFTQIILPRLLHCAFVKQSSHLALVLALIQKSLGFGNKKYPRPWLILVSAL